MSVVKQLFQLRLLPKLIIGTGAGAAAAALAAVMTDAELEAFLDDPDDVVDRLKPENDQSGMFGSVRRVLKFLKTGCVLDRAALETFTDLLLGDSTFEDAKGRTGRELCITIAADAGGTPGLLCHITTPNVLIRSAVKAALISDFDKAMGTVLERDFEGQIRPWFINDESAAFRERRRRSDARYGVLPLLHQDRALDRANQIFDIDQYIASQAHPYAGFFAVQAFNRLQLPRYFPRFQFWIRRYVLTFILGHVRIFMKLVRAPMWMQKLLYDTKISRPAITIVPRFSIKDIRHLFGKPSRETIEYWIKLGEKSVWPCEMAIRIRCRPELKLHEWADQMEQENPMGWYLAEKSFKL